jgi:putative methyltransferase (TIGR04325 family)
LLASLLHEVISKKGNLNVLDFGGSLGSSYFQHLTMFSKCNLSWHVIEQKHFVEAGKKYFQSESLHFHESIDECTSLHEVDFVLLSSVLQYMEEPESIIRNLKNTKANVILIDKTIVNYSQRNRIYVQKVPPYIYPASYPCWSFSEEWLIEKLFDSYKLSTDFVSLPFPELSNINSLFKGYVFSKKND